MDPGGHRPETSLGWDPEFLAVSEMSLRKQSFVTEKDQVCERCVHVCLSQCVCVCICVSQ